MQACGVKRAEKVKSHRCWPKFGQQVSGVIIPVMSQNPPLTQQKTKLMLVLVTFICRLPVDAPECWSYGPRQANRSLMAMSVLVVIVGTTRMGR